MTSSLRFSSRRWERPHAFFHSAFVICVADSQKLMQSSSDLPPPPAILGADSVGLVLEGSAGAILVAPPAVRTVVVAGAERGAMAVAWAAGAPIADTGVGAAADGVAEGRITEFATEIAALLGLVAAVPAAAGSLVLLMGIAEPAGRIAGACATRPRAPLPCEPPRAAAVSASIVKVSAAASATREAWRSSIIARPVSST